MEQTLIDRVKKVKGFKERVSLLSAHFLSVLLQHEGSLQQVNIVSDLLKQCSQENDFSLSLENVAKKNKISLRTLQRYFETCTGISSKQALQVIRIRKAVAHIIQSPADFHYSLYGYYDHSHFFKNLKSFLQKTTLKSSNIHLPILAALHQ